MLNVRGLTELLTQNKDDKLCKRWWLMTPNGTLLAYSHPANTRDLRNQAAMVALSWQEHEFAKIREAGDEDDEENLIGALDTPSRPAVMRKLARTKSAAEGENLSRSPLRVIGMNQ